MVIKDQIRKVIYSSNNFHIYGLKQNGKCMLKFNPDFDIQEGCFVQLSGDITNEGKGPVFLVDSIIEIEDINSINLLEFINGISKKKADEILSQTSYEQLIENPYIIFDFFITPKNKDIFEQIKSCRDLITEDTPDDAAKHLAKLVKGIGKKKILSWMDEFQKDFPYNTSLFLDDEIIIEYLVSDTAINVFKQVKHLDKIQNIIDKLKSFELNNNTIYYLFSDLKFDTLTELESNPYLLINYGIGFNKCDHIAKTFFNIKDSDYNRIINCILAIIKQYENDGHTFVNQDIVLDEASNILKINDDILCGVYKEELKKKEPEFYLDGKHLYRRVIYYTEQKMGRYIAQKCKYKNKDVPEYIINYLKTTRLSDEQQLGVINMIHNRISILTGGPGTGKSTTVNELCNCLDKMGKSILLAAPTGRAAKRLNETTNRQTSTIHRLLDYKPRGIYGSFLHNEKNPLRADYIIIDESSMLDVYILNSLLKAIKYDSSIIFIGDVNQLPSVSMGSVFMDMCESDAICINKLTQVFRQSLDSYIIRNAYNIQDNKPLELNDDFQFKKVDSLNDIAEFIKNIKEDYQILCPMRIGTIGTISINNLVQQYKNNNKKRIFANGKYFELGDNVIQLDNDYNKEVYNGELGVISNISNSGVTVFFENNNPQYIHYSKNELFKLDLSYAISIHKSQGSEADNIVLIVDGNKEFISKELIYTAVTRAKKKVFLLSTFDISFYQNLTTSNNRMTNLSNAIKKNLY